jgi:hypothetical protein
VCARCHAFYARFVFGYKALCNVTVVMTLLHFLFRELSDISRFPYTLIIFTGGLLVHTNYHFRFSIHTSLAAKLQNPYEHYNQVWNVLEHENTSLPIRSYVRGARVRTFCWVWKVSCCLYVI